MISCKLSAESGSVCETMLSLEGELGSVCGSVLSLGRKLGCGWVAVLLFGCPDSAKAATSAPVLHQV